MAAPGWTGQRQPISPAAEQLGKALNDHRKERYEIRKNVMHPSWDDVILDSFLTACIRSMPDAARWAAGRVLCLMML